MEYDEEEETEKEDETWIDQYYKEKEEKGANKVKQGEQMKNFTIGKVGLKLVYLYVVGIAFIFISLILITLLSIVISILSVVYSVKTFVDNKLYVMYSMFIAK